ncbi:uncharacterized protein [Procambarus clarkii]|uniref:uncharacterized protein n=1 Tax=Procambarus clarkii TaxID=6728 RepID=UPI0037431FAC
MHVVTLVSFDKEVSFANPSSAMRALSLMVVLVVALAALMGSALAMPKAYALADPDPDNDSRYGFDSNSNEYGRFRSGYNRGGWRQNSGYGGGSRPGFGNTGRGYGFFG